MTWEDFCDKIEKLFREQNCICDGKKIKFTFPFKEIVYTKKEFDDLSKELEEYTYEEGSLTNNKSCETLIFTVNRRDHLSLLL